MTGTRTARRITAPWAWAILRRKLTNWASCWELKWRKSVSHSSGERQGLGRKFGEVSECDGLPPLYISWFVGEKTAEGRRTPRCWRAVRRRQVLCRLQIFLTAWRSEK